MLKTGSLIALLLLSTALYSAELPSQLSESTVGVGETVTLNVTITSQKSVRPVTIPAAKGLLIAYSGRQQSISIINGQMSRSMSLTFSITATKAGTFTIPPLVFSVDGRKMTTRKHRLTVKKGYVSRRQRADNPFGPMFPGSSRPAQRAVIRPHVDVSGETVFNGQPLIVRYSVLVSHGSVRILGVHKLPMIKDFIVKQVEEDRQPEDVTIDGVEYQKNHVVSFVLIPTAPGTYKLSGIQISVMDEGGASPFGMGGERVVTYKDQVITSLELPAKGKPGSYTGEVGSFSMETGSPSYQFKAYTEGIVTVTVTGKGNLYTMKAPKAVTTNGMTLTPGSDEISINLDKNAVSGSRTFSYTMLQENPIKGDVNFTFDTFNPLTKKYEKVTSKSVNIVVAKGEKPLAAKEEKVLEKEKEDHSSWIVIAAVAALAVLFMVVFIIIRERKIMSQILPQEAEEKNSEPEDENDPFADLDKAYLSGDDKEFLNAMSGVLSSIKFNHVKDKELNRELEDLKSRYDAVRFGGMECTREFKDSVVDIFTRIKN